MSAAPAPGAALAASRLAPLEIAAAPVAVHPLARLGRSFYAVAIFAFGVLHLAYGAFVTRVVPASSFTTPPAVLWVYTCGGVLIVAALVLASDTHARRAAWSLAVLITMSFLVFHLPAALRDVPWGGRWTAAGKALALVGGALAVAGTLAGTSAASRAPAWTLPAARVCLAVFLILCGIQHFIWTKIVVSLVPAWIPGPFFWAYFTGVALIAGGAGLLLGRTLRAAAAASGVMICLWVLMLHIPRALADPGNANETTAVFEALAMSGIAFLLAASARREPEQPR